MMSFQSEVRTAMFALDLDTLDKISKISTTTPIQRKVIERVKQTVIKKLNKNEN